MTKVAFFYICDMCMEYHKQQISPNWQQHENVSKQWNSVNQCTYLCLGHRGLGCDFLRRKIWTVQLILTDNFLTHCFITQLLIVCLSQHRNRNCTDVTFSISEHIIAYGGQHHDQRKARGIALFMVSHPLCFLYVDLGSLRKDLRY